MKSNDLSLESSARFVSNEMQGVFESVIFLMPNWKWLALAAIFAAVYFFNIALKFFLKTVKNSRSYFKDKSFMQFFLKEEIEKSVAWAVTALLGNVLIESLQLPISLEKYLLIFFKLILAYNLIRIVYLAAEAFGEVIHSWSKNSDSTIDDQLIYMASKALKVFVIIIGCLIVLQNFGVNVTALLAGLGLGGVALAFAAQDTVANVFGTITILLDTPFRIGDTIKIGDSEGVVEEVGFRSTRIRTLYNSLIILPNSVVAKEKVDNLTQRQGWIRFRQVLGFTYQATQEQIQSFAGALKSTLMLDPTIDCDRITVTFNSFGESSLNILVVFHFLLGSTDTELERFEIYLNLIQNLMKQNRLDFAFPTRTLLFDNNPAPAQAK